MTTKIKDLNKRIDLLEEEFEYNRRQMHMLADDNRRGTSDYDALLERNLRINEEIRCLLAEMWELYEQR